MDKRKQANRRALILDRLRRKGMQTVGQLDDYLLVVREIVTTPKTVRLDLQALAADGKVKRMPGTMPGHGYGGGRVISYDGWAVVEEGT